MIFKIILCALKISKPRAMKLKVYSYLLRVNPTYAAQSNLGNLHVFKICPIRFTQANFHQKQSGT